MEPQVWWHAGIYLSFAVDSYAPPARPTAAALGFGARVSAPLSELGCRAKPWRADPIAPHSQRNGTEQKRVPT